MNSVNRVPPPSHPSHPSHPSALNPASSNSMNSMSSPSPSPNMNMITTTGQGRWYFSAESLHMTPSRRHNISSESELGYRQQAANFIQDMGQRLHVPQLCINTAIVYMQRFYMFHSFTRFHRNTIAVAALFLAAKVEEQPRKLEHVIKVAHICLHRDQPPLDTRSEQYMEQAQELVTNENILLQTLGFDVAIDHPHTHVVRCCQLVKASKDLAQTSYFMATNSLHLTTMCLRHTPTVVACVCIHLACKWTNYKIPLSSRGKEWFLYVDPNTSLELLNKLTDEFLTIFDRCPSRLKKKIMAIAQATKEEEERRSNNDIPASHYTLDYSRRQETPTSSNSTKHLSIPMGKSGHSSQQQQVPSRVSSGHHGSRSDKPHHYPPHRSSGAPQQADKLPPKPSDPSRATYDEYKKQKQQQQSSSQGQSSRLSSSAPGQHRHMPSSRPPQPGAPPASHQPSSASQRSLSASQNMAHQQKHHKHNGPPPQPSQPQQQSSRHQQQQPPSNPQKSSHSWSHPKPSKPGTDPLRHHKPPLPPPPPQQQQQVGQPPHARHHPSGAYPGSSSQHQVQKSDRKTAAIPPQQQPKKSIFDIDESPPQPVKPQQQEPPPPSSALPNPTSGNGLLNIMLDPTVPLHSLIKPENKESSPITKKEKSVSPNKKQRLDKTASLFSPPSSTSSSAPNLSGNQRTRSLSNCSQSSNEEMSVKLPKVEETPGYEKLRDGYTSIQIPKEPTKTSSHHPLHMKPMSELANNEEKPSDDASDGGRKKHKKEKKSKKEKKEKKDKDRSRDKSHKHKHKDKDKDKSKDGSSKHGHHHQHSSSSSSSSFHHTSSSSDPALQKPPGIKLKIKPIPPQNDALPKVDPLKISLKPPQSSESKKRHRTSSSDVRSLSPSVKIARVIGSNQDLDLFSSSPEIKVKKT